MARDLSAQLGAYFALHLSIGLNFRCARMEVVEIPSNVSADLVCRHGYRYFGIVNQTEGRSGVINTPGPRLYIRKRSDTETWCMAPLGTGSV
jgi:hypothetical protein